MECGNADSKTRHDRLSLRRTLYHRIRFRRMLCDRMRCAHRVSPQGLESWREQRSKRPTAHRDWWRFIDGIRFHQMRSKHKSNQNWGKVVTPPATWAKTTTRDAYAKSSCILSRMYVIEATCGTSWKTLSWVGDSGVPPFNSETRMQRNKISHQVASSFARAGRFTVRASPRYVTDGESASRSQKQRQTIKTIKNKHQQIPPCFDAISVAYQNILREPEMNSWNIKRVSTCRWPVPVSLSPADAAMYRIRLTITSSTGPLSSPSKWISSMIWRKASG